MSIAETAAARLTMRQEVFMLDGWVFFVDELEVVQCCCGGGGLMLSSRSFRKVSTSDFMFRSEDQDAQETLHPSM